MGLGSGIRKKPIPDPGVKKASDPGSGSATLGIGLSYQPVVPWNRFLCSLNVLKFWLRFNESMVKKAAKEISRKNGREARFTGLFQHN
jgi:hypothetical protein